MTVEQEVGRVAVGDRAGGASPLSRSASQSETLVPRAYYNENDPFAAQWLRNLIAAGHIAPGHVDERDIRDVRATELAGYRQCHFFAGIGVWSHALRRAGWPDDRAVWTGSCPCQPFSAAGKQQGFDDARHLWPAWFDLIRECGPAVVLGEQVAGALDWLDLVSADLEGADYAFGAADLCAAGFGGAHIRQRLYFVGLADTAASGWSRASWQGGAQDQRTAERGGVGGMAHADGGDAGKEWQQRGREYGCEPQDGGTLRSGDSGPRADQPDRGMGHSDLERELGGSGEEGSAQICCEGQVEGPLGQRLRPIDGGTSKSLRPRSPDHLRRTADWLFCRDGKWRPVEPGTFPLADAAPARVGRLRAYGNGLDAETAAQFVGAVIEAIEPLEKAA